MCVSPFPPPPAHAKIQLCLYYSSYMYVSEVVALAIHSFDDTHTITQHTRKHSANAQKLVYAPA